MDEVEKELRKIRKRALSTAKSGHIRVVFSWMDVRGEVRAYIFA